MFILDTDHATFYQQGHASLHRHLMDISPNQIATTVITYEEQVSGRLAVVRRAQEPQKRVKAFFWLQQTLAFFCDMSVLPFDEAAAKEFQKLRELKLRIGTQDQLIASIVLANNGTLLTRNRRDFEQIPELRFEDWSNTT